MSETTTIELLIPLDHPTAELHFPGMPIVPGALLLDEIVQQIAPEQSLTFIDVKFIAPAPFGETLLLEQHPDVTHQGRTVFTLTRKATGVPLMKGSWLLR